MAIFATAKMQLNNILKRIKAAKPDQGLTICLITIHSV
jgi:hypothetical protein